MNFQFEIAETIINEDPLELSEWVEKATYDRARGTILIDFPSELTFTGDGFAFIREQYQSQGFNVTLSVIIRKQDSSSSPWIQIHKGLIPLSSCEFNFKMATVTLRVTDETYNSKIRVNSSSGVYAIDPKSKNGTDIASYLPTNLNMSLHNQTTGTYTKSYFAYDLLEMLEHCARWMSDGEIGVVSNWYDALSIATSDSTSLHKIAIITGEEIKQKNSGIPPIVSWDTLTEFTNRAFGLVASVEINDSGETQIRFEPEQDTENDAEAATLENVPEIERSVNLALMYANIKIGSRHFIKDEGSSDGFPLPLVPGVTHGAEEMFLEGQSNTGATKDLTTEICTDTNAIFDLFQNADHEDFDDNIFAIEYELNGATNRSVQAQWFSTAYLYNRNLVTGAIAQRHRWPANVISQYGNDDDTFTAILTDDVYSSTNLTATSGTVSVEPFKFDNDYAGSTIEGFNGETVVEDINNNWGNGTIQGNPVTAANSRYTCPSAGLYYFAGLILIDVLRQQTEGLTITVTIGCKRYDSGAALQQTYSGDPQVFTFETGSGSTTYPLRVAFNTVVFAKLSDYIQFFVDIDYSYAPTALIGAPYDSINFAGLDNTSTPIQWTFFQCLATENGGGIMAAGSLDAYPAEVDAFNVPMTYDQWKAIKESLSSSIAYNGQGVGNEHGWIEDIEYNHKQAFAVVRLRRKFNQS